MNTPRWLKWIGYPAFFWAVFFFSLYSNLPLHVVKDRVVGEMEKALGKGKQGRWGTEPKVTIGNMSPYRLTGVELKHLSIQMGSKDPDPGPTVDVDELKVRVGLLGFLFGNRDISFSGKLYEGTVEGEVSISQEEKSQVVNSIKVQAAGVDLARMPLVAGKVGVPMTGVFGADVDLELGATPHENGKGEVNLKLSRLSVGPGELVFPLPGLTGGLTIPPVDAGGLDGKIVFKEGAGKIEKFELKGRDLEAGLQGNVELNKSLGRSRLEVDGSFAIAEAFLKENGKFQAILDLAAPLKRVRTKDGAYPFNMRGNLSGPKFKLGKGGKSRRTGPKKRRARPNKPKKPEADKDEGGDGDKKEK
jgi:type II secretion system protein N